MSPTMKTALDEAKRLWAQDSGPYSARRNVEWALEHNQPLDAQDVQDLLAEYIEIQNAMEALRFEIEGD